MSVGPQSEADAYETLAYREKRRRESLSGGSGPSPSADADQASVLHRPKVDEYEQMMGTGTPRLLPNRTTASEVDTYPLSPSRSSPENGEVEQSTEAELFARIAKPRVRYDVEVVTKLTVYSGKYSTDPNSPPRAEKMLTWDGY